MKATRLLIVCALIFLPGILIAAEHPTARFDGNWHTKMTCPPRGKTEGYTWQFNSAIQNGKFHGERGTAGEPGYYLLEGMVADDGSAKLAASGVVASREYARGAFAHKGEEYNYDVKAQFKENDGTGLRNEGLGIVGRPCTFEFTRQQPGSAAPAAPGF
jgi:hypothetical protein